MAQLLYSVDQSNRGGRDSELPITAIFLWHLIRRPTFAKPRPAPAGVTVRSAEPYAGQFSRFPFQASGPRPD